MVTRRGKIHIGTSGWYYNHWMGPFYPRTIRRDGLLDFYAQHFDSVELNSTFYGLPSKTAFVKWKENTPVHFQFAVKASRYITHMKKLKEVENAVDVFLDHARSLGDKQGPVLFQMPPGLTIDLERLAQFLIHLPNGFRFAFEFRNISWYNQAVYQTLQACNCCFCLYELAGHRSPSEITADFVYIRLHGPGDKYRGSYGKATLKDWARNCLDWLDEGKDVFIYFDNDQSGFAARNALAFKDLIAS